MKHSVAIVAIARLENQYINEWIGYHRELGFDHIYVYDNSCGNEEHIDRVLTQSNAKVTTIVPAYDKEAYQKAAYNDAYAKFGQNHDYMLVLDIDEFFTLCQHKTISDYIDYLEKCCPGFHQARIHWELYDDNNVIERDLKIPVHKFFTHLANTETSNRHNASTKCLVKCGLPGVVFNNVHYCVSTEQYLTICNGSGQRIYPKSQLFTPRAIKVAKIRHYVTKTIQEYVNQKLNRGDADGYIVRDIENRFFIYCEKTQEKLDYYRTHKQEQKTVLTFTSWKMRIGNCVSVIKSILDGTKVPDIIFLNLSIEEFPNRMNDLPLDLTRLILTNPRVKINWVSGPNTKTMKKVLPILKYLNDDDIIVSTDDDTLFPPTMFESRIRDFKQSGQTTVISTDGTYTTGFKSIGGMVRVSGTNVFSKKMLSNWDMFYTREIINTFNDDRFYISMFYLNGYRVRGASDFQWVWSQVKTPNRIRPNFQDDGAMSKSKGYATIQKFDELFRGKAELYFNDDFCNLFGVLKVRNPPKLHPPKQTYNSKYLAYYNDIYNIGDIFSDYLFDRVYDKKKMDLVPNRKLIRFIGSEIPTPGWMDKNTLCCGMGWRLKWVKLNPETVSPKNFLYTRGKISRQRVIDSGVQIPSNLTVGDTGLLASLLFNPTFEKKYDIGIITHFTGEKNHKTYIECAQKIFPERRIRIISMGDRRLDCEDLFEFISNCKVILASSLHAIIFSHSFGIPVLYFSDADCYKFQDYYSIYDDINYQFSNSTKFQDELARIDDIEYISSVNPKSQQVKKIQRDILQALPYQECFTNFGKDLLK